MAPLIPFGPEIWIAEGPVVTAYFGFRYPTRMVVIRLGYGGLFIWSPIPLREDLKDAVQTLGPVSAIIGPNHLHHLSIPEWAAAFPDARLYAAPGLQEKRKDIAFDDTLSNSAPPEWAGEIDQIIVPGNRITTETVFFHRASATVLVTDLLQQFPKDWFSGWRGIVARLDLMAEPALAVPRKFRVAFTDRAAARRAFQAILDWPMTSLIVAHGAPVKTGAKQVLTNALHWLGIRG